MLNKELLMAGVGEVYADDPFKYLYDKYKWGVGSEYLLWFLCSHPTLRMTWESMYTELWIATVTMHHLK